jgi:hypothetical protein
MTDARARFAPRQEDAALIRRAWLRVIQGENQCEMTGEPCRVRKRFCGCWEEQQALILEASDD